jgi:malonyl-ACP decarboxylase
MFFNSDLCGRCTSVFPIRGFSQTVDAASASGSVAIIQAMEAIRSGRVDVCIALGALQDLSGYDLHAMRSLGALSGRDYVAEPGKACRPMDEGHNGFVYGEACAALVLTRKDLAAPGKTYGDLAGAGHVADGSRGPEPDTGGQVRAALNALSQAGLTAKDIDYVNGHATGTPQGDLEECKTYRTLGLRHAWINATKSVIGHGLSAAGTIEVAAVLIQMKERRLHPTRNLEKPIDLELNWVRSDLVPHDIRHVLKFSFGFGGIDTALVITAPETAGGQNGL